MLAPVKYHDNKATVLTCADCGRTVKHAVTLSDGRLLGLDCAAKALGRPKYKQVMEGIAVEAALNAARAEGAAVANKVGAPPKHAGPEKSAWLKQHCPYPADSDEARAFALGAHGYLR